MSNLKKLAIGTYTIHEDLKPILFEAWKNKVYMVDTAPNYREGKAQLEICASLNNAIDDQILKYKQQILISTKVGFISYKEKQKLEKDNVISTKHTYGHHNIEPNYVYYQTLENLNSLGIEKIDTLFLHNPEVQFNHKNKKEVNKLLHDSFEKKN